MKILYVLLLFFAFAKGANSQNIAILEDADYYDLHTMMNIPPCEDQVRNLKVIMSNLGYTNIVSLPDITNLENGLGSYDFLILPTPYSSAIHGDLTTTMKNSIRSFVNNGGILITNLVGEAFINNIFGFNNIISIINTTSENLVITPASANTCFDSLSQSVATNSLSQFGGLLNSTLPAEAETYITGNSNPNTHHIVNIPYGRGSIFYFGYDFEFSAPDCNNSVSSGWSEALGCALTFRPDPQPIPTLSQWGLLVLFLSISICSILGLRQYHPTWNNSNVAC